MVFAALSTTATAQEAAFTEVLKTVVKNESVDYPAPKKNPVALNASAEILYLSPTFKWLAEVSTSAWREWTRALLSPFFWEGWSFLAETESLCKSLKASQERFFLPVEAGLRVQFFEKHLRILGEKGTLVL